MPLTQSQLDEAMKPGRFDTHVASIGDRSSSVAEPIITTSSLLTKDKSFSSAASPINSLLAGEKIQFGKHALNDLICFIVVFIILSPSLLRGGKKVTFL